jgi:hypothetical protein
LPNAIQQINAQGIQGQCQAEEKGGAVMDFNPTQFDGIKLVVFKTLYRDYRNAIEAQCALGAVEPPRGEDDLLAYVVVNPRVEAIERCLLILPASEYKIFDEDAVRAYWANDPIPPTPSCIQIIQPKKKH